MRPVVRSRAVWKVLLTIPAVLFPLDTVGYAGDNSDACGRYELATSYGSRIDPAVTLTNSNSEIHLPVPEPIRQGTLVRILLSSGSSARQNWDLVIYDSTFHAVAHLEAKDFLPDAKSAEIEHHWTGLLPADSWIELSRAGDAQIAISALVVYPPPLPDTRYYSIKGSVPDWVPLYSSGDDEAERLGASVGMFESGAVDSNGNYSTWSCSGFMVADDVFLTNWHCGALPGSHEEDFWADDVCENAVLDLAWDDRISQQNPSSREQYSCRQVLLENRDLDFALIRVSPIVGSTGLVGEPVHLELSGGGRPKIGTPIFIIHHSNGQEKLLTTDCRITAASKATFSHDCDTEPGASGAPVFDSAGTLLGVHHRGFLETTSPCAVDNENEGNLNTSNL